jgi:hypothetical protein
VVGEVIDSKRLPSATLKRAGTFVLGLVLGAVNPVGVRILTFPLTAIGKRHTFQAIVEWRSPNFQDPATFVALVFIVLSLVVLLRAGLPWAQLLPVCAFIAAALVAERNLGPLGVVLAAPLAAALSSFPSSPRLARLQRFGHLPAWRAGALGAMALVAIGLVIFALGGNTLDLSSYPVAAVDHLAATGGLGPDHRIAAADVVGCYLIWRAGPQTKVFIDDRYDMYPASVVADAAVLGAGRDDVVTVLDRWHIDTVIAHANEVFPAEVARLPGWSTTWKDRKWVVLTRA